MFSRAAVSRRGSTHDFRHKGIRHRMPRFGLVRSRLLTNTLSHGLADSGAGGSGSREMWRGFGGSPVSTGGHRGRVCSATIPVQPVCRGNPRYCFPRSGRKRKVLQEHWACRATKRLRIVPGPASAASGRRFHADRSLVGTPLHSSLRTLSYLCIFVQRRKNLEDLPRRCRYKVVMCLPALSGVMQCPDSRSLRYSAFLSTT
jgi:hypothetical protein